MLEKSLQQMPLPYPASRVGNQSDDYFGTRVADPYRWLEADVRENAEVHAWVKAQNSVTRTYLDALPERAQIEARLKRLWNYPRYGIPLKCGGRYFSSYNSGLEDQDRVLLQHELDAEPRLLFDPNTWSEDGSVALASYFPDPTGRTVAYLIQQGGSDWHSVRIRDLESGKDLTEELHWLKFSQLSWRRDGSGFFYSRYPKTSVGDRFQAPNHHQTVYFHQVGTVQEHDIEVYSTPEHPDWRHGAQITWDDRYLVVTTSVGTDQRYQISWIDLAQGQHQHPNRNLGHLIPRILIRGFEHDYTLVGNTGSVLYFRTNQNAPMGRLVAIDLNHPQPAQWREIVPERQELLFEVSFLGDRFLARYLKDAHAAVRVFDVTGKFVRQVELPGIGSVSGFQGEPENTETFFAYTSFNEPPMIYRYRVDSGEADLLHRVEAEFSPEDYVVTEKFYPSKDGTRVHLFIAHKKDLQLSGNNPTLLYGYGGFNISLTPEYSAARLAWMEMGGVFAMANLRGGDEYGETWHAAGTKQHKQNVFDDFIAAAEFLIDAGYTRPEKLAIEGRSNGGLLIAAVINQRPDLFAAALAGVGVMDMLRFQRFTAGRYWTDDYGSSDNPAEFRALLAYSPYHNVSNGVAYPAVLITTADTDDRVVPGHSFKYAARLQRAQSGPAPILIRIETRAGHGGGTPTQKLIDQSTDMWSFAAHALGMQSE